MEYYYIAMRYDRVCVAGKYKSKQDAENNLHAFPLNSKIFTSECPDIGNDEVMKKAREVMRGDKNAITNSG